MYDQMPTSHATFANHDAKTKGSNTNIMIEVPNTSIPRIVESGSLASNIVGTANDVA
jgi:hypothetical protein